MSAAKAISAYTQARTVTAATATPLENIIALYQRALDHIGAARGFINTGKKIEASAPIVRAMEIIQEGLQGYLVPNNPLSENLLSMYTYICIRLNEANSNKTVAGLNEAYSLLEGQLQSWQELKAKNPTL